ncbi:MAG TPA: hypothetical protein VLH16_05000 [Bacteroidales bacterium]|nr:hypothetical protein [Bacteroidales bacterium]
MNRKTAIVLLLVVLCLAWLITTTYLLRERTYYRRALSEERNLNIQYLSLLNEFIPITGIDDEGNQTTRFYIQTQTTLSLHQQLELIASSLSQYCFSNLPVVVKEIKVLDNQRIAVVNLRELQDFSIRKPGETPSWRYGYFQGSHGGKNTTVLLIESFLQPNHPLPWIDGAIFLYEGQPISGFDHIIGLDGIVYRNNL